MMIKILMLVNMMNFMFFMLSNPMTISINIFIQTILCSIIMGMMINSFWFSYMLFLILVGGLMIILVYMCSISSNNIFLMKFKLITLFSLMMLMMMILSLLFNKIMNMNYITNFNKFMLNNYHMINMNNNSIKLNKLFNKNSFLITLMIINLLFLLMIISSKMINWIKGPLRKIN
uniref:NADH-ubiquinone oxidoreductase chain 6 n=1 Tax=Pseudoneureclipsis achim TaxID=623285 RepID=A0A9E8RT50_9NEOP|nr:NADH dehydrogenase subunit 6 [Pseudoneureclipsis achim]UZZ44280.1 NADH dehydrogenase subunit 6 [Pseudoneureclipsis achim]